MIEKATRRYEQIQEALVTDEEYRYLEEQRQMLETEFHGVLTVLTEEQRAAISAYIGICAEMTERTVEVACFLP